MTEHLKEAYFVENIIPHLNEGLKEANKFTVVLLKVRKSDDALFSESIPEFRIIETSIDNIGSISQGAYVNFVNEKFEKAGKSGIARRQVFLNNIYRAKLMKSSKNITDDFILKGSSKINSYHINVGHGNCSIIVIQNNKSVNIWMVDCGVFDFLNRTHYGSNIDSCLDHIASKFKMDSVHIDKFFLTHPHYDHYSGIERLINRGNISGKTLFYLNEHYCMPSPLYNQLLRRIGDLGSQTVEPIASNSTNNIEIWHPLVTTIKSITAKYRLNPAIEVVPNPNNASAVFRFNFGSRSIVFPGDIQTEKWNTIRSCRPMLKHANYFVISHHGSINGHIRSVCPARMPISNLSCCVVPDSTQILMGRDRAYSGIYSPRVLQGFRNLVYSEKDQHSNTCQFLEIDWQTNSKMWI